MRNKLLSGIVFFFISVSCISYNENSNSEGASKPNIIYILADDLGYGDLGCYGQNKILTPNLDKMAAEGIRFTNHYSGNAVCAPSRYNLMTGKHPGHSRIRGNGCQGGCPMSDHDKTIAEYLKTAGYTTAIIGKWGNGDVGTEGFPIHQGFDFFVGYSNQILAHNYFPEFIWKNKRKIYLNNEVHYFDSLQWHGGYGSYSTSKNEYVQHVFQKEALNYIEEKKDSTFFLYLPYIIPHDNGEAPVGKRYEVPNYGIYKDSAWTDEAKSYAAMITLLDQQVGEIANKINHLGLEKNTLIIFDSDNGAPDNRQVNIFFNSNGSLKGGKKDLTEGGIKVPMIAYWPGMIKNGIVSKFITASWDMLPTFCEFAGIAPDNNVDGISIANELLGKEQKEHEFLYWEYQGVQAVRIGKWKGIKLNEIGKKNELDELYNLSSDENENNNIIRSHPDIAAEISKIIKTQHVPNESFPLK